MLTSAVRRPLGLTSTVAALFGLAIAVGMAGALSPAVGVALVAGAGGAAALLVYRDARVEIVLAGTVLAISALVDAPRRLSFGPMTGSGALTLLLAAVIVLHFLAHPQVRSGIPRMFVAFVAWAFVAFLWGSVTSSGIQNDIMLFMALGVAAIAARTAYMWGVPASFDRLLFVGAWCSLGLYAAAVAASGFGAVHNGAASGASGAVDPRPFALYSLCILAWASSPSRLRGRFLWITVATLALDLASLSRSAFAAALVVVALSRLQPGSLSSRMRAVLGLVVVVCVFVIAALYVKPFHDRFVSGDVQSVGGVSLRLSSRNQIWSVAWQQALQSPVIGNGPGAADAAVTQAFGINLTQPHNDYLRIFDNWGLVGVLLWAGWFIPLLRRTYRAIGTAASERERRTHRTAFLVMVGLSLGMIFDNPMVQFEVMGPLAVFIGLSIGLRRRSEAGRTSETDAVGDEYPSLPTAEAGSIRPL
jgi:O-antigen ligase